MMAGKLGMRWDPTKRRRSDPLPPRNEDLTDPAKGEKVPRCKICGMPHQDGNKLLLGLWGYVHLHIELPICERCVRANLPAMSADPLQLEDVA